MPFDRFTVCDMLESGSGTKVHRRTSQDTSQLESKSMAVV